MNRASWQSLTLIEPIKLYLDEDTINRALIRALRLRGIDVLTTQEAERMATSDKEQLDSCLEQSSCYT